MPPSRRRRTQAASWFARLNRPNVASADLEAFAAWRTRPGAEAAYQAVAQAWSRAGALGSTTHARAAVASALARSQPQPRSRRTLKLGLAGAGAALAAAVATLVFVGGQTWASAPGVRRALVLSDGSRVLMDGGTRLTTTWLGGSRRVKLARGEALFDVAHDPRHPFVVEAGATTVVAHGTRFDVARRAEGARVVLVRGEVDVWRRRSALDRVRLAPGEALAADELRPSRVDPDAALGWTHGRLRFDHTPVALAVEEVGRHSSRPLRLDPDQHSALEVSGEFATDDVAGFLAALQALNGAPVEVSAKGVVSFRPARAPVG